MATAAPLFADSQQLSVWLNHTGNRFWAAAGCRPVDVQCIKVNQCQLQHHLHFQKQMFKVALKLMKMLVYSKFSLCSHCEIFSTKISFKYKIIFLLGEETLLLLLFTSISEYSIISKQLWCSALWFIQGVQRDFMHLLCFSICTRNQKWQEPGDTDFSIISVMALH